MIAAGFALAAAISLTLLITSAQPQSAEAASCSTDASTFEGDSLLLQGLGACSDSSEFFRPFCEAGAVKDDYGFTDGTLGNIDDTGVPCGAVRVLTVSGLVGDDRIDVSGVTSAAGFSALAAPPSIRGGPGSDIVLARNGRDDLIDCGDGMDAVQADQPGLDTLANCEVADVLQAAAPNTPAGNTPAKKCKKKHRRQAASAMKCKRKGH